MGTSHLEREILEQPEALRRLLENERVAIEEIAATIRRRAPGFVVIAARGTSDNAARYGQYLFGAANGLPVALATPSLFTLYRKPPHLQEALVMAISQSGQSPDIVAVVEEARRQGALTVAITNDAASPLARAAEHVIFLHAGQERSIAATKTYTASLLAVGMLSTALGGDEERRRDLEALPGLVSEIVAAASEITQAAAEYRDIAACAVISRGYNYATAFEIALKLKELVYVIAEPYSSADFLHGPMALVERGFPVLAVVPDGCVAGELVDLLRQLRERGARLVVIANREDALALAETPLPLPAGVPEWLSPLLAVVLGQLFTLELIKAKGLDPDRPRGLRKVTLTR